MNVLYSSTCLFSRPHKNVFIGLLLSFLLLVGCATQPDQQIVDPPRQQETVILLHGLGRSSMAMWLLASRLEGAGYKVHNVDYESIDISLDKIIQNITEQIDTYVKTGNSTIHFVGHSLGGLLIRAYLDDHTLGTLGRVVLIGTPNHGTPLVDRFGGTCFMQAAGEAALALGTDEHSFPHSLKAPYYSLGVIAGITDSFLTDALIQEDSDGMVPVSSTQVINMTDFIVIETGHSAMRYNKDVSDQTIHFLKYGMFSR